MAARIEETEACTGFGGSCSKLTLDQAELFWGGCGLCSKYSRPDFLLWRQTFLPTMKFKATLADSQTLLQYLQALERLGSDCLMCLTPDNVYFNLTGEFSSGEQAFIEVPRESLFDAYLFERKQKQEIPFQISLSNMIRALRSCEQANSIVMKLTKINQAAFLNFTLRAPTMTVEQNVPIILQSFAHWQENAEPSIGRPEVQFLMPDLKVLKNVVERMRTVSNEITITASVGGEVTVSAESDAVDIRTYYKGLAVPGLDTDGRAAHEAFSATMDIKKVGRILHCTVLDRAVQRIVGCIAENHAFVLYVGLEHNLGGLTYYVPVKTR